MLRRNRASLKVLLLFALVASAADRVAAQQPATMDDVAQADSLQFGVSTGATWTDNITLLPDAEEDGAVGQFGVDLLYSRESSRLSADVDLNAAYEHYFDDQFDDDVLGGLNGTLVFGLLPERLEWFFQDNFGQTRVDPLAAETPNNRENFNFFTTGPDLTLRLGQQTSFRLSGRYSLTDHGAAELDGDRYAGALALIRQLGSASRLSLNATSERLEFGDGASLSSEYDRHEAYVSYEIESARTNLALDVGYTGIDVGGETSDGELVRLSFARQTSPATSITLDLGKEFSDAGNVFRQEQEISGVEIDAESILATSDAFERRFAYLGWGFDRNRTSFGLDGEYSEETYENQSEFDRAYRRLSLYLTRQMTPMLGLRLDARYSDEDFELSNIEIEELRTRATLSWILGRRLSLQIQYEYRDRQGGNLAVDEYTENRVSLFARWALLGAR